MNTKILSQITFPVAYANTATMIKNGAEAFKTADGRLIVTREWISNNAHLLGGHI